jgi:hypothetical protein
MSAKSRKHQHPPSPQAIAHRKAKRSWTRWIDRWIVTMFVSILFALTALETLAISLWGVTPSRHRDLGSVVEDAVIYGTLRIMRATGISENILRVALGSIAVVGLAVAVGAFLYLRQATLPRKLEDSKADTEI